MENNILERYLRQFYPHRQIQFEVALAEHCNLNCKYCDHFSPIAKEKFLDVNDYARDCARLSKLFGGEAGWIHLMGGEPLLHPDVEKIMEITREAFPIGRIQIVTNGILLPKMPESFWATARKCAVEISPTEYPIEVDYDALENLAYANDVAYSPYFSGDKKMMKYFSVAPQYLGAELDNARQNYSKCTIGNSCITLKDGVLYTCPLVAYACHLSEHFKLGYRFSKHDGIDIYAAKSGEEILQELAKPIPFCSYCDVTDDGKCIESPWGISHKDRYEWLGFGFLSEDIQYLKENKPDLYIFGAGDLGKRCVKLLQRQEIPIKAILVSHERLGKKNILEGVPIQNLQDCRAFSDNSICLVALKNSKTKEEVYPLLSEIGIKSIVPVLGRENIY